MVGLAPLPVEEASSIIKLTCLGRPSQMTPKIPHFLGVLKEIGPGCWGYGLTGHNQRNSEL